MESFFALPQKNILNRKVWDTQMELRLTFVVWVEGRYHRTRRQCELAQLTPIEFEVVALGDVAIAA